MKNIINNLNFNKQIQNLNLKIEEKNLINNSTKKLVFYIKGLKVLNLLIFKFILQWNGLSKNLFDIILPHKKIFIIKKNFNFPSLLEKMQQRIQSKQINNNNLKENLKKNPNLFWNYLISKNHGTEILFDQKFLLQQIEELKSNNLNNNLILDKLLKRNEIIKSDIFNLIFEWYADINKNNNLLKILKGLPHNLYSYKLLLENQIENKIIDGSKLINKLENFKLIFKGQPKIEQIESNFYKSIKEIKTREYVKSLTIFDSNNVNSLSNNYKFFINNNRIPKNIYYFLEYSFLSLFYLISKPFFEITPDKVIIHLFCFQFKPKKKINKKKNFKKLIYLKDNISMLTRKINRIKLEIISRILRKFFKKSIELEIVRLHYPFYNTNIFVNILGKMINNIKLRKILRLFFKNAKIINPTKLISKKISKIPSFISGVKIRVAGRLLTQKIIPRKTVKTISKGSLARSKVIYLEKARFTNKNKRGAFSITVTTGHIKI